MRLAQPVARDGCTQAAAHWLRSPGGIVPVVKGVRGSLSQWHGTRARRPLHTGSARREELSQW